jgi:hypothetical protein
MKQAFILFLFSSIYVISCNTAKNKPEQSSKEDIPFPIIIDTVNYEKNNSLEADEKYAYLYIDKNDRTELSTANHPIVCIGALADTMIVNYRLRYSFCTPPVLPGMKIDKSLRSDQKKYYIEQEEKMIFLHGQESNVSIRIDTTKQINNSYPALLTNNEKDTIGIGYGQVLPLIMEAKDSTGKWRPIEKKYRYFCGVGVGTIILPPKEVVLALVPVTQGNFFTELRLTYGDNHSSPYMGMINYGQFKSRYNGRGNYTEEYERELKEKKK